MSMLIVNIGQFCGETITYVDNLLLLKSTIIDVVIYHWHANMLVNGSKWATC